MAKEINAIAKQCKQNKFQARNFDSNISISGSVDRVYQRTTSNREFIRDQLDMNLHFQHIGLWFHRYVSLNDKQNKGSSYHLLPSSVVFVIYSPRKISLKHRSLESKMATINIAKMDLETINAFQEELHRPSSEEEEIVSDFFQEFRKTSWYTHMPVPLEAEGSGNNYKFNVNPTWDYLLYTYLRVRLPALRISEKVRGRVQICWTHNVGVNFVREAHLMFDTKRAQRIDSVWFDIYSQWFMKPGFREHHNVDVGNVPFLEDWGESLPSYMLNVQQPWYYCRDTLLAIPILFCSLTKVYHQYEFRNRVGELLRMRLKDREGEWRQIKPNLAYLEGVNATQTIGEPQLWGRYAYLNEDERRWQKTCKTDKTIYIDDVLDIDVKDSVGFGRTVTAELDCKTPCKAIFWMAEHGLSREINNHSNYTTDLYDMNRGWDPTGKINLTYGGQPRLKDMDSDHFSRSEPWHHFVSPPSEMGYHAYSIARDSSSLDASLGLVMSNLNVKLSVQIVDGNPFLVPVIDSSAGRDTIDDDLLLKSLDQTVSGLGSVLDHSSKAQSKMDTFLLRVRLLITRKLTFTLDPEKQTFKVEIV